MPVDALAECVKERIHFVAGRVMAPARNVRAEESKRRATNLPDGDVAQFLLASSRLFDMLACTVNSFIPGNALEARKIAAFDRLKKRILQTVGSVQAFTFGITLHAGATLHLTDRFVRLGRFATRNVTGRGQRKQSSVFDMGL